MTEPPRPDWLSRHLETLPEELEPDRDLWPGIARHLTAPRAAPWRPGALAAVLVLAAGFALFGWQSHRAAQAERAATEHLVAELLDPYGAVHADQTARWRAVRPALDPDLARVLDRDMDVLVAAHASLSQSLVDAPTDPALHRLMQQVVMRRTELIETGARWRGDAL